MKNAVRISILTVGLLLATSAARAEVLSAAVACEHDLVPRLGIQSLEDFGPCLEPSSSLVSSLNSRQIRMFSDTAAVSNIDTRRCTLLRVAKASCYGKGDNFNGKKMADGIRFDTSMMTAAHPTAPLDSTLVVVNPATQIAREVLITDRGPSRKMQAPPYNRAIDLSRRAFDSLGGALCPSVKTIAIYQCPEAD